MRSTKYDVQSLNKDFTQLSPVAAYFWGFSSIND
jgi:hypothetical protein